MTGVGTQRKKQIVEFENKYLKVYSQEVDFGSFKKTYYATRYGDKAGLVILNGNSVLLARQYRFLIDGPAWEIPGGRVEEGEDPLVSATRECEEETGIKGLNLQPLLQYRQGLDCLDAHIALFYTNEFEVVNKFQPNPKEVDMIQWVPFKDCLNMIKSGEIMEHFTITALLYYQHLKMMESV